MSDAVFKKALSTLLIEIFDGPPANYAFVLNQGDPGLPKQLEEVSAEMASTRPMPGATTIAAHVDHVDYGLSLLNRWAAGEENPWATADWNASWRRTRVNEEQWRALRDRFGESARKWRDEVARRDDWNELTAAGALASAAHTAYHLGAIRQILAAMDANRAPK